MRALAAQYVEEIFILFEQENIKLDIYTRVFIYINAPLERESRLLDSQR
jgi:hypothetical protein